MSFTSCGHLLRINLKDCYGIYGNVKIYFDGNQVVDGRIQYILKNIIREVVLFESSIQSDSSNTLYDFLLVTTDRDPNEGKYQTICFRGPLKPLQELDQAFMAAMSK